MFQNPSFGGLPFSTTQPQMQIGHYNVQMNIQVPPQLQQWVPVITQLCARTLADTAMSNPLRLFMWNQMSASNFQNQDFFNLVCLTMDYFAFAASQSGGANAPEIARRAAEEMCENVCALNVRQYQPLQQFTNPDTINQLLHRFNSLSNQIAQFKNGGMQQQPMNQFAGNNGFNQQPMGFNQQSNHQQNNQIPTNFFSSAPVMASQDKGDVGRAYFTGSPPPVQEVPVQTFQQPTVVVNKPIIVTKSEADFDLENFIRKEPEKNSLSDIAPITKAVKPEINIGKGVDKVSNDANLVLFNQALTKWKPSNAQAYRPAYEPSHQHLVIHVVTNELGGTEYIYEVINITDDMDITKHRIPQIFKSAVNVDQCANQNKVDQAQLRMMQAVKQLGKQTMNETPKHQLRALYIERDMELIETVTDLGHGTVWAEGRIAAIREIKKRQAEQGTNFVSPEIIHWQTTCAQPVVMQRDHYDVIKELQSQPTIMLVRDFIQSSWSSCDPELMSLISIINRRICATINRMIKQNLSIQDLSMENFMEDYRPLVDFLRDTYGESMVQALISHQDEIFKSSITFLDSTTANLVTSSNFEVDEEEKINIVYLIEKISFTILQMRSDELDINFVEKTSALLQEDITPKFYHLAKNVYERSPNATRHLVQTMDDSVLEITRGWLNRDSFLITKL